MSVDIASSLPDNTCPAMDSTELAPAEAHTQRGWRAWSEGEIVDWPDQDHRPWHTAVTVAAGVLVACVAVALGIASQGADPGPVTRADPPRSQATAPPPVAARPAPQQSAPAPAVCCSPSACFPPAQAPKPCTAINPLPRPLAVDPAWPRGWQIAARAGRPVPPPFKICYATNGVPIPLDMYAVGPGTTGSIDDCNVGN